MTWTDVVSLWSGQGRWDWLFESLPWMGPQHAPIAFQALQSGAYLAPSPAARQQLSSGDSQALAPWGRPPWGRLLLSGADELVLDQLDHHYSEILATLKSPSPELDRLLRRSVRPGCPPQLAQLIQDLNWQPAEQEEGWAESCLLTGRTLPPARLLQYLAQPEWTELASRQLASLPFPVALSLLLRAKLEHWNRLPPATARVDQGLLEVAQHYPELHSLILASLAGEPGASLQLWAQTRQPQLRRHCLKQGWKTSRPGLRVLLALARQQSLQDFTSEELLELKDDGQFSAPIRAELASRGLTPPLAPSLELAWSQLRSQPPGPASQQLLELAQDGWRPQFDRALFARLCKLVDDEPIRRFLPNWTSLMETRAKHLQLSPQADRLALWLKEAVQIWSYPELQLLGECQIPKNCGPGQLWFLPEGVLLRQGRTLTRCQNHGQILWTQPIEDGPVALSPCATRLAQAQGQQLQVISLEGEQSGLKGATELPQPVISRGPIFVGGWAPQSLAWSPDGRRLATTHKEKIQIWDSQSLTQICQAEQIGQVSWVGFYEDLLAAGCIDRLGGSILLGLCDTISLFEPGTGQELHRFGNLSAVRRVSLDGPRLLVQGGEGLYALQGRREVGRLEAKDMELQEARDGYARVLFEEKAWLVDARRPEQLGRIPKESAIAPGLLLCLQQGQLQASPLQDDSPLQPEQMPPSGRPRGWLQALQEST